MNELTEHDSNIQTDALSLVLIKLMKGVIYLDDDALLWQHMLRLQTQVRDYVRILGLELSLAEDEGVAWLTTRKLDGSEPQLPSLISKRQLSFPVSLLLVLLRRKLVEHDASSGEQRLIIDREDLVEQIRIFLPAGPNEARLIDQVDTYINKIIELGFIRRLKNNNSQLEIKRILKVFVDAQWLHEFDQRLHTYALHSGLIEEDIADASTTA